MLVRFFLFGFASGLPFLLTLTTLSTRLTEAGVSCRTIGLFVLVTCPYSLKFLMSPWMDTVCLPYLGRKLGQRRSWALVSQSSLIVSILTLGYTDPQQNLWAVAWAAFWVCLSASTQDLCLEAYRIETTPPESRGAVASALSVGFRCGLVVSGAGSLSLASWFSWPVVHGFMASSVGIGMLAVLLSPPSPQPNNSQSIQASDKKSLGVFFTIWVEGMKSFFRAPSRILFLGILFFYKLPETTLNVLNMPFLLEMGYTKVEIATRVQFFGILFMIVGSIGGGLLLTRFGLTKGLLTVFSLHFFASMALCVQSLLGRNLVLLTGVMSFENFTMGMTTAVLTAYIGVLCAFPFTATHYAFVASCASLSRVLWSVVGGQVADTVSWASFFLLVGAGSLIGLLTVQLSAQALRALWAPPTHPPRRLPET